MQKDQVVKHYINGQVIKKRAKELFISMKGVEALSGKSKPQFYRYINGQVKMRMYNIQLIADKLEIDIQEIIN